MSYLEEGNEGVNDAVALVRELLRRGLQGQPVAGVWDELAGRDKAVLTAADRRQLPRSAAELKTILDALAGGDWEELSTDQQLGVLRLALADAGG